MNLKLVLVAFAISMAVAACETNPPEGGETTTTTLAPVTTTLAPTTTTLAPVVEPGEKPVDTTELGLNIGLSKKVGSQKRWSRDGFAEGHNGIWSAISPCAAEVDQGKECIEANVSCKKSENPRVAFTCQQKDFYQTTGWVYEKLGKGQYVRLEGADVYLFWFAGCIAGICGPMSGIEKTNQYGYFNLPTENQMDTIRVRKAGYFSGQCVNGKPYEWAGDVISGPDKFSGPYVLEKLTSSSCAPVGVAAKSAVVVGKDGIFKKDGKKCMYLPDGQEVCK